MIPPIQSNESLGFSAGTPVPIQVASSVHVEHTPANASTPNFNVNDLLDRKLANPSSHLEPEESIAVLMECIRRGEIEAAKAENRNLVVIIGNTGSGKSTFGNAICGCKLERVKPKSLGLTGVKEVVAGKRLDQGRARDEIMPIGHTTQSKTFMPQLVEMENGMSLCDCPGFLDNRGHEINIANAVNIRKAFIQAKSVKVVILINFHALEADRSRGLRDMIKLCCDLFGSKENLVRYKNSILLGITQVTFAQPDEEQELLDDLKEVIKDTKLKDEFEVATLRELSERLFIYDPLDAPNLKYAGALTKEQVVGKIAELECIRKPGTIFKTVLNDSDIRELIKICDQIQANIQAILRQKSLSENDFKKAAEHLESLRKLEIIEHQDVFELVAKAKEVITRHFHEMIHRFDHCCADETYRLADESQAILTALKQGVQKFDEQIQSQVGIKGLEEQYALFIKKKAAKQAVFELADLQKNFYEAMREAININNFVPANYFLDKIKQKLGIFEEEYRETGISPNINFEKLESFYTQTLTQQDLRQLKVLEAQLREAYVQNELGLAKLMLDEIKEKTQRFETDYREIGLVHNVNLKELENLYTEKSELVELAKKTAKELELLEEKFKYAWDQNYLEEVKFLLIEIQEKARCFETVYRETGITYNLDVKQLISLYKNKIKDVNLSKDLKKIKKQFEDACTQRNLGLAKSLLIEIKEKMRDFKTVEPGRLEKRVASTTTIDVAKLESSYTSIKESYKAQRRALNRELRNLEIDFWNACNRWDLKKARSDINKILKKTDYFKTIYRKAPYIDLQKLESSYTELVTEFRRLDLDAIRAADKLEMQRQKFMEACKLSEFGLANSLLDEIKAKVCVFETKCSKTGRAHNINVEQLERIYTTCLNLHQNSRGGVGNKPFF
ncbi:GTPase [Parachlamydia sp. AcF125]|uniref:GTPase n=1 Tax=Parachlamydia sp. AcF125 TaxID=2795736 RepID=UPI001BCA4BC5|nr:GTPase [Parachlamydia sp. AcF125]MBS4167414.1 hypothetical protein [Parachlamydia sp. AcF125]